MSRSDALHSPTDGMRWHTGRMSENKTSHTETAYFAGGCFWGLERYFQAVDGVVDTTVGYAQSKVANPTYKQVCSGETDAAETVKVTFVPSRVTLRTLSLLFLEVIDPFSVDAQGPDHGRQYRTGMFYLDGAEDKSGGTEDGTIRTPPPNPAPPPSRSRQPQPRPTAHPSPPAASPPTPPATPSATRTSPHSSS